MGSLLQNTVFGRTKNSFVSTWRTSNTSTGSSASTQVKLPLISSGIYNFTVDWGDGTSNKINVWNQAQTTHSYAVAGDYTIKITGTCTGWFFNNTGDRLKIRFIESWGKLRLGNSGNYFYGCTNLNLSRVTDVLDLTGTTILASCFRACGTLTTINRLNEWNTSLVANMDFMFQNATAFNQNIGVLNVSAVSDFTAMFQGCGSFNNGSNSDINNWIIKSTGTVTMGQMFANAGSFNQPLSLWNTSAVTNMSQMFQNANSFSQNIGAWNVSNVTIFSSMFSGAISFNNGGSNTINNWITSSVIAMNGMFSNATVFNQPIGNWNTSNVTTFASMFSIASAFNQNIGAWNVSKSISFGSMFSNAINFRNGGSSDINNWVLNATASIDCSFMFRSTKFNQPLNNWITTRVTNMNGMFNSIGVFDQDIGSWDVSNVTNMDSMFGGCTIFNQNLGAWNVANVFNFTSMFYIAPAFNNGGSNAINNWSIKTTGSVTMAAMFNQATNFNQPIGLWNTSAVVSMNSMFQQTNFNQNLGAWNVSSVTDFTSMFSSATAFNNGGSNTINNWVIKTTGIVNMTSMFSNAVVFNQPIGNWNMSAVTSTAAMLTARAFNQDISSWNVSNVTTMSQMFYQALLFNQNIGGWNVSSVTNMGQMFQSAFAFNQNIGAWNVSNVTNFSNFMAGKTVYSASNLDAIYNGWSSRLLKSGISITFGTAKYTAAGSTGRAVLTESPNNWSITDGGI